MWEAIKEVLNGANALFVLGFIGIVCAVVTLLIRNGYIKINTKAISVGDNSERERTILQQQIDQARVYIMSLESKIMLVKPELKYGGFFAKWILEQVFDEVVQWITFNHISRDESYVHVKQMKMCSLVYSLGPDDNFKTPEFKERIERWVKELIDMLLTIREVYSKKK